MKFALGSILRDSITGFTGTATSRVEYLTGCVQYGIVPKCGKDGKSTSVEYYDEQRLVFVKSGPVTPSRPTGGPQRDCPTV